MSVGQNAAGIGLMVAASPEPWSSAALHRAMTARLSNEDWIAQHLQRACALGRKDPTSQGLVGWRHSVVHGWHIAQEQGVRWALLRYDPDLTEAPENLRYQIPLSSGYWALRVLHGEGRMLSIEAGGVSDVIPTAKLSRHHITKDTCHILTGERVGWTVEAVHAPMAILVGEAAAEAAFHDPQWQAFVTGDAVNITTSPDRLRRVQARVAALRTLGRADAVPVLARLTEDADPQMRWAMMREWLAIDTAGARGRLQAMAASDPDPAVRHVAAQVCEKVAAYA